MGSLGLLINSSEIASVLQLTVNLPFAIFSLSPWGLTKFQCQTSLPSALLLLLSVFIPSFLLYFACFSVSLSQSLLFHLLHSLNFIFPLFSSFFYFYLSISLLCIKNVFSPYVSIIITSLLFPYLFLLSFSCSLSLSFSLSNSVSSSISLSLHLVLPFQPI